MIFKSVKYKTLTLLSILALGCAGCHHSDDPCPLEPEAPDAPDPDKLTLCLNITFEGQESETRADLGDKDDYEEGSGDFESISTLRVIIVRDSVSKDEDGNPTGEVVKRAVEANRLVATSPQGYPLYDNLQFKVIADEDKRIYLIANERSLTPPPGEWETASEFLDSYKVGNNFELDYSKSALTTWTVSLPFTTQVIDNVSKDVATSDLFAPTDENKLPLTEFFDIKADSQKTIDDIYYSNLFITRAAAKATFYLKPDGLEAAYKDVQITSISLSGVGAEEYVFPLGEEYLDAEYSKGKYQEGKPDVKMYIKNFKTPSQKTLTYLINKENIYNEEGEMTGTKDLSIEMVPEGGANSTRQILGPIYFPESILKAEEQYEVTVTLSTGAELKAPLVTNILNIGGREAVARNTHLQITLEFSPQNLMCEVSLVPYIGILLEPSFGFENLLDGDHVQPTDW